MPVVSVTRLRLRSLRFLPSFLVHASRAAGQARAAAGCLGVELRPDRGLTFWTLTAWEDEAAMRAYVRTGAHHAVMPRLMEWCSEAAVAHWEQETATLPGWGDAYRRLVVDGRPSKVRYPSAEHEAFVVPAPRGYDGA